MDERERGREAYRQRAWLTAYKTLSGANEATALGAEDLELLATSAYLIGHNNDGICALDRAHRVYLDVGEPVRAARCAIWLGFGLIDAGEIARATGSASGAAVQFSDGLEARLAFADQGFDKEFRPMFDAYIAAAGIDAPSDDRRPYDDFMPTTTTELDLDAAGVGAVVWATGYQLDFGWVDVPVLDQRGYPRHLRGVTTHPGL